MEKNWVLKKLNVIKGFVNYDIWLERQLRFGEIDICCLVIIHGSRSQTHMRVRVQKLIRGMNL